MASGTVPCWMNKTLLNRTGHDSVKMSGSIAVSFVNNTFLGLVACFVFIDQCLKAYGSHYQSILDVCQYEHTCLVSFYPLFWSVCAWTGPIHTDFKSNETWNLLNQELSCYINLMPWYFCVSFRCWWVYGSEWWVWSQLQQHSWLLPLFLSVWIHTQHHW